MFRALPVMNRICNEKEIERQRDIHQKKINSMQSSFRQMSPQNYSVDYKLNKQKRQLINESRFTEIERENRILLEKITHIMISKQVQKYDSSPKSLNKNYRKSFVSNISAENSQFIKRLQEKRSSYSVKKWEDDFQKNQKMAAKICLFPLNIGDLKSTSKQLTPQLELNQQQHQDIQLSVNQKQQNQREFQQQYQYSPPPQSLKRYQLASEEEKRPLSNIERIRGRNQKIYNKKAENLNKTFNYEASQF